MSKPRILKAVQSLAGTGNEKLKVRWSPPGGEPRGFEYYLHTAELETRVKACRAALHSLQMVADQYSDRALTKALRQLVDSGGGLYELLMSGSGGRPEQAAAFREWFEQTVAPSPAGTWRVEFQYQGVKQPAIPWGLTCSTTTTARAESIAYEDYVDFWAHRYSTASYVQASDSALVGVEELDGQAVQCSLLIEVARDAVDLEVAAHDGDNLTMRVWGPLRDHTIRRIRDLRERFRAPGKSNHIVYLNLRTKGGYYPFPDGSLTPTSLAQIAAYLDNGGGHAIAMIDREAIIRSDRGPEWLYTFFNDHWAGLIAAETDITSKTLQHHGFQFLTELLDCGVVLTKALPKIRKQLWPYSLLYGVYSNPDRLFIKPPSQIVKEMRAVLDLREQDGVA